MNILQFKGEAHHMAVNKGFWEEKQTRSRGEMVALMVTELSEAIEAHRKAKKIDPRATSFEEYKNQCVYHKDHEEELWLIWFKDYIKDSIGDELADTAIRILDYIEGWEISAEGVFYYGRPTTGNFAHDILNLQVYVIGAFESERFRSGLKWGHVLDGLVQFCEWYGIDLCQQIEWKMRYNKSRPYKHNKAY